MLFVILAVFVGVSGLFFWMFIASKSESLKRNGVSALRTTPIATTDETWAYIHRRYAPIFCIEGLLFLGLAGIVIAGMVQNQDINDIETIYWISVIAVGIVAWLLITIIGVLANNAARIYNRQLMGRK